MHLRPLQDLVCLSELLDLSQKEGFRFLLRLKEEWESGVQRFNLKGEVLLGLWEEDRLIAVGGLRIQEKGIGRLSRIYIHPDWRRKGVGRTLVAHLIASLPEDLHTCVLRTDTAEGVAFYESLGFRPVSGRDDKATHLLSLPLSVKRSSQSSKLVQEPDPRLELEAHSCGETDEVSPREEL